jgi:hypothetical protein
MLAARGDAISELKAYFREFVTPQFSLASETAGLILSFALTSMHRQ